MPELSTVMAGLRQAHDFNDKRGHWTTNELRVISSILICPLFFLYHGHQLAEISLVRFLHASFLFLSFLLNHLADNAIFQA